MVLLVTLLRAWLGLLLVTAEWLHARTVGPLVDWLDESILGAWEESAKLFVREFFTSAKRLINGFCSHLLGLFDAQYRASLRETWAQKEAWHSWWREDRQSTLNAVLQQTRHQPRAAGSGVQAAAAAAGAGSGGGTAAAGDAAGTAQQPRSSLRGSNSGSFGRLMSAGSSNSLARAAGTRISWLGDAVSATATARTGSSSGGGGGGGGSARKPRVSAFADAAAAAAAAAADSGGVGAGGHPADAGLPAPHAAAVAAAGGDSSSSWLARAIWWSQVGLLGRARTPPAVMAAAMGRSSNPLFEQPPPPAPSLPSTASLTSLRSCLTLRSAGSSGGLESAGSGSASSEVAAVSGHQGFGSGSSNAAALPRQQPWLLSRLADGVARWCYGCAKLLLLPFVAPVLPAWWVIGWVIWGRTQEPQLSTEHTPAAAAGAGAQQQQQRKGRQRAAPWHRRSIIFDAPSGFGAQEATRRRGLLEELSVASELVVTWVFDTLRAAVRLATLTRSHKQYAGSRDGTPTARQQQHRRLAAAAAAANAGAFGDDDAAAGSSRLRHRHSRHPGGSSASAAPSAVAAALTANYDADYGSSAHEQEQQQGEASGRQASFCVSDAAAAAFAGASSLVRCLSPFGSSLSSYHSGGGDSSCSSSSRGSSPDGGSDSGSGVEELLWGVDDRPGGAAGAALLRSKSVGADMAEYRRGTATGSSALPRLTLRRVRSVSRWSHNVPGAADGSSAGGGRAAAAAAAEAAAGDEDISPAAQCILSAGYPLELHSVTTSDGVVLRMERIPRPGCSRVAFFQHGILDTQLSWVSSGVTGSQAFAAWDQGFDVWLGSSRSNPPRVTRDPSKQGLAYFAFSLNELGIQDIPAQLDHLHSVKMRELAGSCLSTPVKPAHGSSRADFRSRDPLLSRDGAAAAAAGHHHQQHSSDSPPSPPRDCEAVFGAAAAAADSVVTWPHPTAAAAAAATGEAPGEASPRRSGVGGLGGLLQLPGLNSMKRTLSDSGLAQMGRAGRRAAGTRRQQGVSAAAAATAGGSSDFGDALRHSEGSRQGRGGGGNPVLRAAGRLLRAAVRSTGGGRRRQQQEAGAEPPRDPSLHGGGDAAAAVGGVLGQAAADGSQQPWHAAAAMAAVVSAAAASAAATAAVAAAAASSGGGGVGAAQQHPAERQQLPPAAAGRGLLLSPVDVNAPSTPDVLESPRWDAEAGAAAALPDAAAVGLADGSQSGQQQPAAAGVLLEAVAAAIAADELPLPAAAAAVGPDADEDDDVSPFLDLPPEAEAAIAAGEVSSSSHHPQPGDRRCVSTQEVARGLHGGSGASSRSSSGELFCDAESGRPGGGLKSTGSWGTAQQQQQWQQWQQQQQAGADSSVSAGGGFAGGTSRQRRQQQQRGRAPPFATTPAAAASSSPAAAAGGAHNQHPPEPYDLRVVAHSLGGASMLIYAVMRAAAGQPHRLRRLVLMSPAGFHDAVPWMWWPLIRILPWWHALLCAVVGKARAFHPALLPTYAARGVFFSWLMELARLPAMADLARAALSAFFGGDASEWERALLMPHYSAAGMPACSLHQGLHFIQIIRGGCFSLFDYGSPAANMARYGLPRPPNIAAQYWRLAGLPIDLMAGSNDGIIPPSNVRRHLAAMQAAGLQVTYREFGAIGHVDFTFSTKDELRHYVMRALTRPG